VQAPCLEYALNFERQGVWGGTTERDRKAIRRRRRTVGVQGTLFPLPPEVVVPGRPGCRPTSRVESLFVQGRLLAGLQDT
jgi:hypothetical protein